MTTGYDPAVVGGNDLTTAIHFPSGETASVDSVKSTCSKSLLSPEESASEPCQREGIANKGSDGSCGSCGVDQCAVSQTRDVGAERAPPIGPDPLPRRDGGARATVLWRPPAAPAASAIPLHNAFDVLGEREV